MFGRVQHLVVVFRPEKVTSQRWPSHLSKSVEKMKSGIKNIENLSLEADYDLAYNHVFILIVMCLIWVQNPIQSRVRNVCELLLLTVLN